MGAIRIRCGELREHLYTEGYARCLESMSIDWDVGGNVKQLWEQVKLIMVDSRREDRVMRSRCSQYNSSGSSDYTNKRRIQIVLKIIFNNIWDYE